MTDSERAFSSSVGSEYQYNNRHFCWIPVNRDMRRRQYVGAVGAFLGSASVAGCTGLLPFESESDGPEYPGGTLIIKNTGKAAVNVSVTVSPDEHNGSLDATVSGGETRIQREFVTAERGDVVTVAALLGDEGEPIKFQFLPAGGEDGDAPPEVARLTFESAVEASATWSATGGT
jgi:hypothetical protein